MPELTIFGELEKFLADDLYPYRYLLTPLLAVLLCGLAYLAYKRGAYRPALRHPLASTLIAVPLLVTSVVAGNYLLSPLWERSFLEEQSPLLAQASPTPRPVDITMDKPPAVFEAMTRYRGSFQGADDFHFGRGAALLIETSPGSHVLRFENFSVRNGPDLYVYLSEESDGGKVSEALNLGRLKATDGAFNYEIPVSIDISKVRSAIVWCRQFSVQFSHAELLPE